MILMLRRLFRFRCHLLSSGDPTVGDPLVRLHHFMGRQSQRERGLPTITQQASGRARTRPRHLPPGSRLCLCHTLSNLICSLYFNTYLLITTITTPPDLPPHTQGGSHLSCLCSHGCKARACHLQEDHPDYPTKPIHTTHPPPNHPPIFIKTQPLGLSSLTVVASCFISPGRRSAPPSSFFHSSIFFLLILLLLVLSQLQTLLLRVTKYGEKRVTSEVRETEVQIPALLYP